MLHLRFKSAFHQNLSKTQNTFLIKKLLFSKTAHTNDERVINHEMLLLIVLFYHSFRHSFSSHVYSSKHVGDFHRKQYHFDYCANHSSQNAIVDIKTFLVRYKFIHALFFFRSL